MISMWGSRAPIEELTSCWGENIGKIFKYIHRDKNKNNGSNSVTLQLNVTLHQKMGSCTPQQAE